MYSRSALRLEPHLETIESRVQPQTRVVVLRLRRRDEPSLLEAADQSIPGDAVLAG
jgi:hypothetical protein